MNDTEEPSRRLSDETLAEKRLRHLRERRDRLERMKRLDIPGEAWGKLMDECEADPAKHLALVEGDELPTGKPHLELLVIDSVPRINHRVMGAHLSDGTWVTARCRDNRNYMKGMTASAYDAGDGVWVIEGKGPRYRGRW